VAIVDGTTKLRSAFELGAHFVLYKPISSERAKTSFRAVRALMKRERRRNIRVAIEIPVTLTIKNGDGQQRAVTSDLSEGGMAIQPSTRPKRMGAMSVQFTLPGTAQVVKCMGEVAWENNGRQTGVRFVDMSPEIRDRLKAWISNHSPDSDQDDPPVPCKLSDLSLGGCYLETTSPFPERTRVVLSMRIKQLQVKAEGVVRVMHPEVGMGVEFTQKTTQEREHVEKFIHTLTTSGGALPDLLVEPEGFDGGEPAGRDSDIEEPYDPLLDLFRNKAELDTQLFLAELRKQRRSDSESVQIGVSI
jgi:c-di-GMP-binding flagellar brake protein YcgR